MKQFLTSLIKPVLAALPVMLLSLSAAQAGYIDKSTDNGYVRIHYPEGTGTTCDAVVLGVGTAMSTEGYDRLSAEINKHGHFVVIMDHQPGNLTKTDANKYANLANDVKNNMIAWLGNNTSCQMIAHWIMGGHSAGGQASQNAVANDSNLADAVFSIDPYDMSNASGVNVPALYWGFDQTTCFVDKNKAAKRAYNDSQAQRAFVKVGRKVSWGPCGPAPKYFHCSFCDNHCPACTNCMYTPDHFFVDVANSVDKFIAAAFYTTWSKSNLSFSSTTPKTLYVDSDQP